jgi:hypothetical protein
VIGVMTLRGIKMRGIFCLAGGLLASQEGLFSIYLVNSWVLYYGLSRDFLHVIAFKYSAPFLVLYLKVAYSAHFSLCNNNKPLNINLKILC